jgi:zinc and cadmium transporter
VQPTVVIAVYSVLVVLSSLLGGFLPAMIHLTHRRMQFLMSGIGGLMLGIGFFHLLPHSLHTSIGIDRAVVWLMLGLITTFLLIRVFSSHVHAAEAGESECSGALHESHQTGDPHASGGHNHAVFDGAKYRWVGLALGLSLHTLLDGVAMTAAVLGDTSHVSGTLFLGFAAFLGILLHKPLDSLSITALMAAGGWSVRWQSVVNVLYAMMCPLGALAFYLGVRDTPHESVAIGCGLAFAAGIFICIALSDLLPELQFHSHDRFPLTVLLLLGVLVAYGLKYLEPPHLHDTPTKDVLDNHSTVHDHEHHSHDPHPHAHDTKE